MIERDTIPRLHRVVEHLHDQLVGIADGAVSFEDARVRYGDTQERLARQGRGRLTTSRVPENERNWSPARETLAELMKIGALKNAKLPSARKFVDGYRNAAFELTDAGHELAEIARAGGAPFVDRIAASLIAAHPYLRRLLVVLRDGPIVCPVVSERDVQRGRDEAYGLEGWGRRGAEQIGADVDPAQVARTIAEHVKRRFGNAAQERPSNKAMSEVLNDALAVAGFEARGLSMDANTIKTLMRWGGELMIFDQSRYVPEHPDANVVWLACDLVAGNGGAPVARRRGLRTHGDAVGSALVRAYDGQAAALDTMLAQPYLPIFRIRAQAAFETNTMRALGDLVLAQLIDGHGEALDITAIAYIGTSSLPASEPPFRHRNRRRLDVQILKNTSTAAHAAERSTS
ncbi:MAG TPA: hypothetical protein VGO48_06310 [Conexibacter sp.]|jgi:hypothetical protein|nr:hypothetical protein [Conexibacter sp.]